ncbi:MULTISPECIES: hypothetical protein [unclassified Streptomyces]|nr:MULTISPECIES: hypothetical protein [unclassified Streptomyces]
MRSTIDPGASPHGSGRPADVHPHTGLAGVIHAAPHRRTQPTEHAEHG